MFNRDGNTKEQAKKNAMYFGIKKLNNIELECNFSPFSWMWIIMNIFNEYDFSILP